MASITLTGNPSLALTASADGRNSTLNRYLQNALVFAFDVTNSKFEHAANTPIAELDTENFPCAFSASDPASFKVSHSVLSVKGGASADLDLLTGDKARDFLKSVAPSGPAASALVSFAIAADLEEDLAGGIDDFSFGLTSGQQITVSNYCAVAETDCLADAAKQAIVGLTIPHDLDDLRAMPAGSICRLEGKGTLKFTASAEYNFLHNTLANVPLSAISQSLAVNANSGAKLQFAIEHTSTHQLTIAATPANHIRLSAALSTADDATTSFDLSFGVSATVASEDALEFLVNQLSPGPEEELRKIRQALPADARADLSAQIKKAIQGAAGGGIEAELCAAFEKSRETDHLFVYDVDLNALDAESVSAVESALRGDFTPLTADARKLTGVQEIDTVLILTATATRTITVHLIGILNCNDVSSFVRKATAALNGDSGEIVLTAKEIKIVENNLDADHLREVLLRCAMITTAAVSSADNPDFKFKMVFFLRKQPGASDLIQMANALRAVSSPDTRKAEQLAAAGKHAGAVALYLSLDLDKQLSLALFSNGGRPRTSDDYVAAGERAMAAILASDEASANRARLCTVDLAFWNLLRDQGARPNVIALLKTRNITDPAAAVDFTAIDWWAQAMARVSTALANKQSLEQAEKDALKKSEGGFDIPWALVATYFLLGEQAHVSSQFTPPAPAISRTAAARGI